jgi:hypothetical protein
LKIGGGFMVENGIALDKESSDIATLCRACHELNSQRIILDKRIIGLLADDPSADIFWQELADVLTNLRNTVGRLLQVPASQLTDVRSKADVLATLILSTGAGCPIISDDQIRVLALSLADDVIGLPE